MILNQRFKIIGSKDGLKLSGQLIPENPRLGQLSRGNVRVEKSTTERQMQGSSQFDALPCAAVPIFERSSRNVSEDEFVESGATARRTNKEALPALFDSYVLKTSPAQKRSHPLCARDKDVEARTQGRLDDASRRLLRDHSSIGCAEHEHRIRLHLVADGRQKRYRLGNMFDDLTRQDEIRRIGKRTLWCEVLVTNVKPPRRGTRNTQWRGLKSADVPPIQISSEGE